MIKHFKTDQLQSTSVNLWFSYTFIGIDSPRYWTILIPQHWNPWFSNKSDSRDKQTNSLVQVQSHEALRITYKSAVVLQTNVCELSRLFLHIRGPGDTKPACDLQWSDITDHNALAQESSMSCTDEEVQRPQQVDIALGRW